MKPLPPDLPDDFDIYDGNYLSDEYVLDRLNRAKRVRISWKFRAFVGMLIIGIIAWVLT